MRQDHSARLGVRKAEGTAEHVTKLVMQRHPDRSEAGTLLTSPFSAVRCQVPRRWRFRGTPKVTLASLSAGLLIRDVGA
jgi:hypothetical protein